MADVDAVLTAFRAELVTAGLVRRPSEAGGAGVHPMHIAPVDGPPAPGEREGIEDDPALVLSLMHSGDLSEAPAGAAQRARTVLDVRYRTVNGGPGKSPNAALRDAYAINYGIRSRLIRPATNYGFGFTMGGLFVLEVAVWGGLGPVSSSKAAGFDLVSKWMIETEAGV